MRAPRAEQARRVSDHGAAQPQKAKAATTWSAPNATETRGSHSFHSDFSSAATSLADVEGEPAGALGRYAAVTLGGMQGHFELNVFVPLIARNVLESIRLLAAASRMFAEKCVEGIGANRGTLERYAELTLSAATALNPYIGYDKATEIVKEAAASGRSLREVAREAGVEEQVIDEALDYRAMANPHRAAKTPPS